MKTHRPAGPSGWHRVHENAQKGAVYLRDLLSSTTVYRYLHQSQFKDMLSASVLNLARPHGWDDPHEKWWCDELFRAGSALHDAQPYASCWTVRYMDEPFWRFYSCKCKPDSPPPPPAVRIRTTVGKLVQVLSQAVDDAPAKVFIGRVRYCSPVKLATAAKLMRERGGKDVASEAANGLHMKRSAFRFEQEVRALWIDKHKPQKRRHIPIDPLWLFDQVMVGPSNKRKDVDAALELARKYGIPRELVQESTVYRTPAAFTK
jgi:hypothetical protein